MSAHMADKKSQIIYTLTDEAPLLATRAFLPIVRTFAATADIDVVESDISVAARILGEFSDLLPVEQRVTNNLAELGKLTLKPDANIIKLPNISASVGQLTAAIKELQAKGYALPDYPENAKTDEEKDTPPKASKPKAKKSPATKSSSSSSPPPKKETNTKRIADDDEDTENKPPEKKIASIFLSKKPSVAKEKPAAKEKPVAKEKPAAKEKSAAKKKSNRSDSEESECVVVSNTDSDSDFDGAPKSKNKKKLRYHLFKNKNLVT